MHGDPHPAAITLGLAALGLLMPMALWLDGACRIRGAGPTIAKLMGEGALGRRLDTVFALRNPRRAGDVATLLGVPRLVMTLRGPPGTGFKGVAVPLAEGGALLNLSFGFGTRDAVRDHALSASDFAVTDLVVELLYLAEAKAAVTGEVQRMAERLKASKARAEAQAVTDALTGLGNRRAMESALGRFLAQGEDFALIHVDLDFFKEVNDSLGHAAGDHVLGAVAQVLRASVRAGDLVTRVGGDEFVILLAGVHDAAPLRRVGEQILARMAAPILYGGQPCRVALSMGAVLADPAGRIGAEALMAMADRALYASKGAGRARLTLWTRLGTLQELAAGAGVCPGVEG